MTTRHPTTAFVFMLLIVWGPHAQSSPVTYQMVNVGDSGNTADGTGFGSVASAYSIGRHEVTIAQYAEFLNAVAKTDVYSLYDFRMATYNNIAGITRADSWGSYTYSVIGPSGQTPPGAISPGNRPITFVSWFDAARFANWMHNGQQAGDAGTASTETGAYTLNGATSGIAPAVNPGATFFLPTENQWYKAAYYKGGGTNTGYWTYATQSDADPGNSIGTSPNQANYFDGDLSVTPSTGYSSSQNYLTEVGAFTNSESTYGTFDQIGNVSEWNDLTGGAGALRGLRGGWWGTSLSDLSSSTRYEDDPSWGYPDIGFRLAGVASAPVPEIDVTGVGSVLALLSGVLGLLERRRLKVG